MQTFKLWLEMKTRDYSSVQFNLPDKIAKDIIQWGKDNIPDEDLFKDPDDPTFGRELEIHTTVLYGIHNESPQQTQELTKKQPEFEIELGKVNLFTNNDKFDVVKIEVISGELRKLNQKLRDNVKYTATHPGYKPHVTIAYTKKETAWKHTGEKDFTGEKMTADEIIFSSKNGTKTTIPLQS